MDAKLLIDPFTLKHGTLPRVSTNSNTGYQLCDIAVCLSVPMQKHEHSQTTLREMSSYGHVPPYRRTAIPLYRCTAVPLYRRSAVPLYRCTAVPPYRYTAVPLYRCTAVPLYRYTAVPPHRCTTVPLYRCTAVPPYRRTAVRLQLD